MRWLALGWVVLAAQLGRADVPPPGTSVFSSYKVFTGPQGQRLELGMQLPLDEHRALVRLTGTDTDVDGLVLPGTVTTRGRDRAFTTRLHGNDFELLRLSDTDGTVFLPGDRGFKVKFNQVGDAAGAQALGQDHRRQLADGSLGLVARKDFPFLQKKYDGLAQAALAEANQACHGEATFTFDWGRFPDAVMEEVDVWKRCAPFLALAKKRCPAEKTWVCSFGKAPDLERVDGKLVFTTTAEGDVASFLGKHLEKTP